MIRINFFPFYKSILMHVCLKLLTRNKIIVLTLYFVRPSRPGSCRNAKFQVIKHRERVPGNGGFSCTGGGCKYDYSTFQRVLSTCSLIFSKSSFISTTTRCMLASLALAPRVFISLPISWAIKLSFFPEASSLAIVSKK